MLRWRVILTVYAIILRFHSFVISVVGGIPYFTEIIKEIVSIFR